MRTGRGTVRVGVLVASAGLVVASAARGQVARAPLAADGEKETAASIGYHLERGPWETGEIRRLTLHDASRDKDLIVTVHYPMKRKDATDKSTDPKTGRWHEATFPMVVFSHGLGGAGWLTFPDLADHWASYGYVVVLPTHSDSIALRKEQGKEFVNPLRDKAAALATVDLRERVADVKFVLDSIPTIEENVPEWKGAATDSAKAEGANETNGGKPRERIDRDRLAVAGHSAGAYTAQLAIGVKARGYRATGQRGLGLSSVGDPRLKAAIIVSGQGTTTAAFTKDSWKELDKPILVITGSKDTTNLTKETPESRRHPYEYSRSKAEGGPGAYLLWIEGATHGSYQGKGLSDLLGEKVETPIKTITDATASATLAFLDAWVKGDSAAKKALESDATKEIDAKLIRWEWK